jgi:hypothetical protein
MAQLNGAAGKGGGEGEERERERERDCSDGLLEG